MHGIVKIFTVTMMIVIGFTVSVHADIATVSSVRRYIQKRWDVTLADTNPGSNIMDMSYLMKLIDTANERLNGTKTSSYATNPVYATNHIVSTSIAGYAVEELIKPLEMQFWVIPETTGTTFKINIAAAGTFFFAWGDGQVEQWSKGVGAADISHTYPDGAANYKIYIGGEVTEYPTVNNGSIYFGHDAARKVRQVGGCLGCVFHTIGDGTSESQQPKFHQTFASNTQLKSVPDGFFAGLHGKNGRRMFYQVFMNSGLTALPNKLLGDGVELVPADEMFADAFREMPNLAGQIPGGLFSGLRGAPAHKMFDNSFHQATGLNGPIPSNLFDGISGAPAGYMFNGTFYGCSGLTGEIPDGLFSNISGDTANNMFEHTFAGCTGLTSIGRGVFGDIYGGAKNQMFMNTFYGCTSLTGPSAVIGTADNRQYLYERWNTSSPVAISGCYTNDGGLTDYACIPQEWGGGGTQDIGTCE